MFAKLDDYVFGFDSGAGWSLSTGVAPYQSAFVCDKIDALKLLEKAKVDKSTLTINDGNEKEVVFEKLTILRLAPTNNPNEVKVIVADRRWHWDRKWIKRAYNIRRRSGTTRKLAQASDNVKEFQQDIMYQTWSLSSKGKPWEAKQVLEDIGKELVGADDYELKISAGAAEGWPVIEGLEIDSPGDVALGRILSVLGNMASVYITPSGKLRLYDAFSGMEGELVGFESASNVRGEKEGSVDLVVGYPTWVVQDRRIERPVTVRVLFTRALELRLDNSEYSPLGLLNTKSGQTTEGDNLVVGAEAMNVVPVPENVKGKVDGIASPLDFPLGSYVTIDLYLKYLEKQGVPDGLPSLTRERLNRLWMHGALDAYGALDPSGLWSRRIGSLRAHYRRTYRVARPYIDRIRMWSDRRVKLQDIETDGYMAAPAFFDYAEYQSWRGVGAKKAADGPKPAIMIKNRFANKSTPNSSGVINSAKISELNPAPANISMIDPVVGIFTVNFYQDISARATKYIHSALDQNPTEDPTGSETWLQDGHLVNRREMTVILTSFPAAPNDNRQLYAMDVNPEAIGKLGKRPYTEDTPGIGPVVEVRVMPNVAMARYQWPDEREKERKIKEWFAQTLTPSEKGAQDALQDNAAFGLPINPEELQAVAFLKAKEVFARYVDHIEGGATSTMRPELGVIGTVKEIVHSASPSGALTSVTFPPDPPRVDLSQLMPASVRKLVDRSPLI